MVSIVITGHGNFATGIESMLKLVIGECKNVFFIDFTPNLSSHDLTKQFQEIYTKANGEVIFLCDIAGGTPFNQAALLMHEYNQNYAVLGGVNIPCILDALDRRDSISDGHVLLQQIKRVGCDNMRIVGESIDNISTYKDTDGI
ncbi:MAG: PTS fructose transporter subunit IIA [Brevinema sp.]